MPQIVLAAKPTSLMGSVLRGPASQALTGKSFAVFVASYNTTNDKAQGGVAGTAFFVSPHKAITAFHVLQDKSFKPAPGYERVKVWLVHENHIALEVTAKQVSYRPDQDTSIIDLGSRVKVAAQFIFATEKLTPVTAQVEAEGFMANSIGPVLERRGSDIAIVAVPKLERMRLSGTILKQSEINLRSQDLNLKSAACVQLSYQPIRGFSGGPVTANGKVIGMNSFADPEGSGRTWALQLTSTMLN